MKMKWSFLFLAGSICLGLFKQERTFLAVHSMLKQRSYSSAR